MRKQARALVLVILALLTSVVLGVASAFTASLALGATVLIAPGTGTHNANDIVGYNSNALSRYVAPISPICQGMTPCTTDAIEYPASFFPLGFIGDWCPGYKCDTWNQSVATGVSTLNTAIQTSTDPDGIILFGYSQGGAVVSDEMRALLNDPTALAKIKGVVMIGNILNPDGGLWNRLGFFPFNKIPIPGLNLTFGPPMPTDFPVPVTNIGFQYDPVVYAPKYWGNPFSLLNALAAFDSVHGNYLTPNSASNAPMAYGYTDPELAEQLDFSLHPENFRSSGNNTYVMIPAKSLPIVNAVMAAIPAPLQPVAKPFADLVSPTLKVLIDLGYDWSGDPNKVSTLSLLPFNPIQNWPTVAVNLVVAAVQGVQAFVGDLGGLTSTLTPAIKAPASSTQVSTLAVAKTSETADTTDTTVKTDNKKSTPKLQVVKDTDTSEQQTAVENETPASTDDTPATMPEQTTDEKKADDGKADDGKKADDKKADHKKGDHKKRDVKKDDVAKVDNDAKADTDKKDADTAKAAA
jgi:PE-PPE domain-containing protein